MILATPKADDPSRAECYSATFMPAHREQTSNACLQNKLGTCTSGNILLTGASSTASSLAKCKYFGCKKGNIRAVLMVSHL